MQAEIDIQYPGLGIAIVGVNEAGHELANADMCEGRELPWLQDTSEANWWGEWDVVYRDVIVVGRDGVPTGEVVNLTDNDLGDPDVYVELKSMLLAAAEQ